MRRAFTLCLTSLLLWALISQINHALSGLRMYIFAGALFVCFPALALPLRSGLAVSCFGGFVCDANSPVSFGTHLLLFAAAHATLYRLRDRVPRDDTLSAILVALLTNLALFLVFSFTQIHGSPSPSAAGPRLLVDLVCSQIVVALITPWFFALQARSLELSANLAARYGRSDRGSSPRRA